MEFKDPWILFLIPFFLVGFYLYFRKREEPSFRYPGLQLFSKSLVSWKIFLSQNIYILRLIIFTLFLIALAGPREILERTEVKGEGIDIILAVDASGSMAALDFKNESNRVDRLTIVKEVVKDFVEERSADRIGLIAFAGKAYTVCPLTMDYEWLTLNLDRIELGLVGEDGTAIGSAIASSVGRLKESDAKSKVVILLTDGVNNAGAIKPLEAARAANALDIKIYTIGAGSNGLVPFPGRDFIGRIIYQNTRIPLDEETLKKIAKITDGLYFRAKDTESLRKIYKQIDKLEKTEIIETGYREYKQLFDQFLILGCILLIIESVLLNTVLLKIP